MSTKKNIMYKPYLETKIVIDGILLDYVMSIEETKKEEQLAELQRILDQIALELKMKEEEERAKAEAQKMQEQPETTTTDTTILQTTGEIQSQTESPKEGDNANPETPTIETQNSSDLNDSDINSEENAQNLNEEEDRLASLPTRESIIEEYNAKIAKIKKLLPLEVYQLYSEFLVDFDFFTPYFDILTEQTDVTNLAEAQLPRIVANARLSHAVSLDIKLIMFMEDTLLFNKISTLGLNIFQKTLKLRLHKWRFKKKKLRKLYILKKLKKVLIFRKYKTKHYNVFCQSRSFFLKKYVIGRNVLNKKIPISSRMYDQYNIEFFYRMNKYTSEELVYNASISSKNFLDENDDLIVYLRNYHQKPYWKLRKARRAHWDLFFKKTIRKQRYKKFINKFMKTYDKLSYSYTFFVNFFTRFNLSWTRTNKLEAFCKRILIVSEKTVLKLPLIFSKIFNWKVIQKRNVFLKKKIGKWSFLNFKRATRPWLQRKKKTPKVIQHVQPNCFFLNYVSYFDVMTGYIYLQPNNYKHMFPVLDEFKVNSLVKLHMYRYKSNS